MQLIPQHTSQKDHLPIPFTSHPQ